MKDIYLLLPPLFRLAEGVRSAPDRTPSGKSGAPPVVRLDPTTVREVLGAHPDLHQLAIVQFDVLAAVARLEAEIRLGVIGASPLRVCGRPLADWLDVAEIAWLIRAGKASQ